MVLRKTDFKRKEKSLQDILRKIILNLEMINKKDEICLVVQKRLLQIKKKYEICYLIMYIIKNCSSNTALEFLIYYN